MPRRRRVKEIQRNAQRAAKHPDLRGSQVEPVGKLVQMEDAWAMRTCSVCSSPHCLNADHWEDD